LALASKQIAHVWSADDVPRLSAIVLPMLTPRACPQPGAAALTYFSRLDKLLVLLLLPTCGMLLVLPGLPPVTLLTPLLLPAQPTPLLLPKLLMLP
jgi:hypothetical protein